VKALLTVTAIVLVAFLTLKELFTVIAKGTTADPTIKTTALMKAKDLIAELTLESCFAPTTETLSAFHADGSAFALVTATRVAFLARSLVPIYLVVANITFRGSLAFRAPPRIRIYTGATFLSHSPQNGFPHSSQV
jgi:hypothetical protein